MTLHFEHQYYVPGLSYGMCPGTLSRSTYTLRF